MEQRKENIRFNEKTRLRCDNWTQEEKDLLIEIMKKSAPIVENKLTDTTTNRSKKLEWLKIRNKLTEVTGKSRDIHQLKGFWRRIKLQAKKNFSEYRKAVRATGDGQRPPSPPPEDLKILELCSTDLVKDENLYDSDEVSQIIQTENLLEVSLVDQDDTFTDINIDKINVNGKPPQVEIQENEEDMVTVNKKSPKNKFPSRAAVIDIDNTATILMEEEYDLKIKYSRQELAHQKLRHKLEIELLMIEKEKKMLELEMMKKKFNTLSQV